MDWIVFGAIVASTWLARKSRRTLKAFIIVSAIVGTPLGIFTFWMVEHHSLVRPYPYSELIFRYMVMSFLLSVLSLNFLARMPPPSETRKS